MTIQRECNGESDKVYTNLLINYYVIIYPIVYIMLYLWYNLVGVNIILSFCNKALIITTKEVIIIKTFINSLIILINIVLPLLRILLFTLKHFYFE